jgi:hypothetical protein
MSDHSDVTTAYFQAADATLGLLGSDEVGRQWTEPSVLVGYDVGGLAAHVGRSVLTVQAYLDGPPPEPGVPPVDAAGYFVAVLGDHHPVESDLHRAVRARAAGAAARGRSAVLDEVTTALDDLRGRALAPDRLVAVIDGVVMRLDDYLRTRLVELLVHGEDVADSVGVPAPGHPAASWALVAETLHEVALGLARPERHRAGAFGPAD